jgi:hypothetical protein
MRRIPDHRYQSADAIVGDLDRIDALDPLAYDLSPEPPMGGMAAVNSVKRLWALVAMIAVGFVGVVAVIITLSVVFR